MSVSTVYLTWPAGHTHPRGITRDVTVPGHAVSRTVSDMLTRDAVGLSGGEIKVLDHDTRAVSVIRF